ncbi:hypothetical protein BHM03_00039417 [Ensete ventricosum]|nr:hypothetical protein BHM03_00039417 [Ensete ventricosum]
MHSRGLRTGSARAGRWDAAAGMQRLPLACSDCRWWARPPIAWPLLHDVVQHATSLCHLWQTCECPLLDATACTTGLGRRWMAMTTLWRKPRQPEGPSRHPIWNPRWRCPNTTQPSPCPLMRHGDPCPCPMPLQSHVLCTSRPYPEGRLRIAIPETAPGTHRPNSPSRTLEGASIHRKFRPPPTSSADRDDPSHCPLHPSTGLGTNPPTSARPLAGGAGGSTPVEAVPRGTPQRSTPPTGRGRDREHERLGEIDEVQRDFVKSKEEVGETTKGGSPFAPEILDKPIPSSFQLPALEPYDGSTDPMEHVTTFRVQIALYDTSDALMCRTFPTTLRGPARMWYSRIKPFSISSFDQFAKEFELNFIASSCPRPTAASLLGLTQGYDEPLAQFVSRFSAEIRRMPDTHPTLAIQAFLMGLRPSRFFWSLIERPPFTVPEIERPRQKHCSYRSLWWRSLRHTTPSLAGPLSTNSGQWSRRTTES